MGWISVDVDIDDVISAMSRWDRKEFFKALMDDGYVPKECTITDDGELKLPGPWERRKLAESTDEFNHALQKLFNNGWRVTKEEEDYIINLSKRF